MLALKRTEFNTGINRMYVTNSLFALVVDGIYTRYASVNKVVMKQVRFTAGVNGSTCKVDCSLGKYTTPSSKLLGRMVGIICHFTDPCCNKFPSFYFHFCGRENCSLMIRTIIDCVLRRAARFYLKRVKLISLRRGESAGLSLKVIVALYHDGFFFCKERN